MNLLAENRYDLTRDLFYEGMGRVLEKTYGKTANRAVLALLAAWLLLTAATLLLKQSPVYIAVEAVVLALLALWIKVYVPRRKIRAAWKKLDASRLPNKERTTRFYDDHLVVQTANREVEIPWEDIDEVLTSERLLIIIATDKTGVLVKRDAFVKGSESTVLALVS